MFINFGEIKELNSNEFITIDTYNQIEIYLKQYIDKGHALDEYGSSDKASVIW